MLLKSKDKKQIKNNIMNNNIDDYLSDEKDNYSDIDLQDNSHNTNNSIKNNKNIFNNESYMLTMPMNDDIKDIIVKIKLYGGKILIKKKPLNANIKHNFNAFLLKHEHVILSDNLNKIAEQQKKQCLNINYIFNSINEEKSLNKKLYTIIPKIQYHYWFKPANKYLNKLNQKIFDLNELFDDVNQIFIIHANKLNYNQKESLLDRYEQNMYEFYDINNNIKFNRDKWRKQMFSKDHKILYKLDPNKNNNFENVIDENDIDYNEYLVQDFNNIHEWILFELTFDYNGYKNEYNCYIEAMVTKRKEYNNNLINILKYICKKCKVNIIVITLFLSNKQGIKFCKNNNFEPAFYNSNAKDRIIYEYKIDLNDDNENIDNDEKENKNYESIVSDENIDDDEDI
eukprot:82905_1